MNSLNMHQKKISLSVSFMNMSHKNPFEETILLRKSLGKKLE